MQLKEEVLLQVLDRLKAAEPVAGDLVQQLSERTEADAAELSLISCSGQSVKTSIERRLRDYRRVVETLNRTGFILEPISVWSHYLPLVDLITAWAYSSTRCLVGLAGPPGVGKTTLAAIIAVIAGIVSETRTAVVSLDDFYFEPVIRLRRGYKWRAVPGTHDLKLMSEFLVGVKSDRPTLSIPRYDTRNEVRLKPVTMAQPDLVLFEGWFVGAPVPGYEMLTASINHLLYVDMNIESARQCRLDREAKIRAESNNAAGMTPAQTRQFWSEALLPNINKWVLPLSNRAGITLKLDSAHRICEVLVRPQAV